MHVTVCVCVYVCTGMDSISVWRAVSLWLRIALEVRAEYPVYI